MAIRTKWTTETFIQKLKSIFGDKYDYSFIEYAGVHNKVTLFCKEHGFFSSYAGDLLKGHGCAKCNLPISGNLKRDNIDSIRKKCYKIHGDKYEIPDQQYINNKTKILVICKKHGKFNITPNSLLRGSGCRRCAYEKLSKSFSDTNENFKKKLIDLYGYEKYDCSLVDLAHRDELGRITLICHNKSKNGVEHGKFKITPNNALRMHGCPMCKQSRLEHRMMTLLINNNIKYVYQCRKSILPWLGNQSLDFYLPDYNIAIECQGFGHYSPVDAFNGVKGYEKMCQLDKIKAKKCFENGVKLIYYTDIREHIDNIKTFGKDNIINIIKNGKT